MKRRILAVALVVLLIVSLAACGGSGSGTSTGEGGTSGKTEIVFWAHQEDAWKASYDAIVEGFMAENEDITVKTEYFTYDEYEAKVQSTLLSDSGGADVIEIWGGWALDYSEAGALAEIPEEMSAGIRNDAYDPTFGALERDGKLYGLPMEFNIEFGGMLANNHLMEDKGFSLPATWDELIEQGKASTVFNGDVAEIRGFDFANWDSLTYIFTSMILSSGGQYWTADGGFDFTSKEAKDAFTILSDLVTKEKVTDLIGLTGGESLEGYQQLYADHALYVPRGPWVIAEGTDIFELELGKDFSYAKMPTYNNGDKFAAETGWSLTVNKKSEKQEAAFKFLEYFFSDEVLLKHNIACGMIPPKKSIAQSPELTEAMPFMSILVPTLDNAQFIGSFNTDRLKENVNDVFVDYCSKKYDDVDAALAALQSNLDKI
jgi:multiple sugar transport system substrate-binding protein